MSMRKLRPETVKRRLDKIERDMESEKARYARQIQALAREKEAVQDRCPHPHIDCIWNDSWNGWDDHDDLKGDYDYTCKTCGKRLKTGVVKSEHEKLRHNIRQACGLE